MEILRNSGESPPHEYITNSWAGSVLNLSTPHYPEIAFLAFHIKSSGEKAALAEPGGQFPIGWAISNAWRFIGREKEARIELYRTFVLGTVRGGPDGQKYDPAAISTLHWIGFNDSRVVIASLLAGIVAAIFLWLFSRRVHRPSGETLGHKQGSSTDLLRDSLENVDHPPDAGCAPSA